MRCDESQILPRGVESGQPSEPVVTYDDQRPSSITEGRWTFQGDFVLRALASEPAAPDVRRMEQVVNQAPLEMTVRGGDVTIENRRQGRKGASPDQRIPKRCAVYRD